MKSERADRDSCNRFRGLFRQLFPGNCRPKRSLLFRFFTTILLVSVQQLTPALLHSQVKIFVVNEVGDRSDPNAGQIGDDGACDVDPLKPGNQCSFRAAIQNHNGNRHLGQNEIRFNIPAAPGNGSIVINVGATGNGALPNILGSVIINGVNEPDSRRIELDGTAAGGNAIGLSLLGGECRISSFIINSFGSHGIFISGTPPPGGGKHIISGNYIGTDSTGNIGKGNGGSGIFIDNTPDDTIGGSTTAERNVISANKGFGVEIHAADPLVDFRPNAARNIVVAGNYIGLSADGNLVLPNVNGGVLDDNAPNNTIGGEKAQDGNKIAGSKNGITVQGNLAEGVSILGNFVGKDGTSLKLSAGILTKSGRLLTIKGNFVTNIDSVGIDVFLNANGSYDVMNNRINGDVKTGVKFTFGPGRSIDVNYLSNIHVGNQTGLSIDESVNSTINWLVSGDTVMNGNTGGNLIFRAGGKKDFTNNRWEANAGVGLKYGFDLAQNVNVRFSLDGTVSAKNGGAGFEGDVRLASQASLTYSLFNVVGNDNAKDGYKLALRATAGAASSFNFSGKSDFSFNGGFGLAITGDKVILDVAKFSFEKSSAKENIDGAFYLFDVKFPFSITDNDITGNRGPAITLDGEAFAHIDSNRISRNGTAILLKELATARINNNIIFENLKGIAIAGNSTGTPISANSIFANTGPGIDLGDDGVTPNHPGGHITGPNFFQNYPVLTGITSSGGNTIITGNLNSAPNTTYRVEFFSSPNCHPSGLGEGRDFLFSSSLTTDAAGNVTFSRILMGVVLPSGVSVTSTATDPQNNTSEFSNCIVVGGGVRVADLLVTKKADKTEVSVGEAVTFNMTVENKGPSSATTIVLKDSLPEGLTFQSANVSAGSYNPTTGMWMIPSLLAGRVATFAMTVTATSAGNFINLLKVQSLDQSDNVTENNGDTALVRVTATQSVQAMINALIMQVQALEQSGKMIRYPAADIGTTLRLALRQTDLSNESAAIKQLQIFILIVQRMNEIGYVDPQNSMVLISAANSIIQELMKSAETPVVRNTPGHSLQIEISDSTVAADGRLSAYPNPFTHQLNIDLRLATSTSVEMSLYDVTGQLVCVLLNKQLPMGTHKVEWKPANLASGVYYLHTRAGGNKYIKAVLLNK